MDQIGIELQNPFAKSNLSHLPLGDISATIEKNLIGLHHGKQAMEREASTFAIGSLNQLIK